MMRADEKAIVIIINESNFLFLELLLNFLKQDKSLNKE